MPPPTTRPRPPGRRRSIGEGFREQRAPVLIAGIVAGLSVVALVAMAFVIFSGDEPTATTTQDDATDTDTDTDGVARAPLFLPLEPDDVGFNQPSLTVTPDGEGPNAISYCNNRPVAEGLVEWQGNRITDTGGRRRIGQLVARFRSSVDAAAFVASNRAIVDCDSWDTENESDPISFILADAQLTIGEGDEAAVFELQATTAGPDLFLRVILLRFGPDVAQFTIVTANRQELPLIDRLATEAATEIAAAG